MSEDYVFRHIAMKESVEPECKLQIQDKLAAKFLELASACMRFDVVARHDVTTGTSSASKRGVIEAQLRSCKVYFRSLKRSNQKWKGTSKSEVSGCFSYRAGDSLHHCIISMAGRSS